MALADISIKQENIDKAIKFLEIILNINPKEVSPKHQYTVKHNLSVLYFNSGRNEKGLELRKENEGVIVFNKKGSLKKLYIE